MIRRRANMFAVEIDGALAAAEAEGVRVARGQFMDAVAAEVNRLAAIAKEHDKKWTEARARVEADDAEAAPKEAAENVAALRQARLHAIQSRAAAETAHSILESLRALKVALVGQPGAAS